MQFADLPRSRAELRAGSNIAARMAMMAMTTSNSIKVNACAGDKENFFSREKKFSLSPAPPFSFKKSGLLCFVSHADWRVKKYNDEITVLTRSSIRVKIFRFRCVFLPNDNL